MKTKRLKFVVFITVTTILFLFCNDNFEESFEQTEGKWELKKMEYVDSVSQTVTITDCSATLELTNIRKTDDKLSATGLIHLQDTTIQIDYTPDISYKYFTIRYNGSNETYVKKLLPLGMIGNNQVYDFKVLDKNNIYFFHVSEQISNTNALCTNCKYFYTRIRYTREII